MGKAAAPRSIPLRGIDEDFPGWHAWRSDAGRAWATRTGPSATWGRSAVPMTVDADSETQLREVLEGYRDAA